MLSSRIHAREHCHYCQRLQGQVPEDDLTYADRCYDADEFGGNHEILTPEHDFKCMRDWLDTIHNTNSIGAATTAT